MRVWKLNSKMVSRTNTYLTLIKSRDKYSSLIQLCQLVLAIAQFTSQNAGINSGLYSNCALHKISQKSSTSKFLNWNKTSRLLVTPRFTTTNTVHIGCWKIAFPKWKMALLLKSSRNLPSLDKLTNVSNAYSNKTTKMEPSFKENRSSHFTSETWIWPNWPSS